MSPMIRAFYGLTKDPFDLRDIVLLPAQQEIHDTLKVHCQQGGLCLLLGVPGSGKSVVKQSLQHLPENQHLVATVSRTLHTYTNTVKILCEAFRIEFEANAFKCERKLIEQAFSLNRSGKCLTTILDDAHLMDLANLRKLRLLFEDFPKNHNLVLIGPISWPPSTWASTRTSRAASPIRSSPNASAPTSCATSCWANSTVPG